MATLFDSEETQAHARAAPRLFAAGWKRSAAYEGHWWSPDGKRRLPWREALAEVEAAEKAKQPLPGEHP